MIFGQRDNSIDGVMTIEPAILNPAFVRGRSRAYDARWIVDLDEASHGRTQFALEFCSSIH